MRDFIPIADLQMDHAPFANPNFKLAVIDQLLENGTLKLGERHAFWDRLTGGTYDYEEEGYALKQSFLSYFRQYPLTAEHLAAVDALYFDGGNDIYSWIFPFWGGETEDFDITSLADMALLPKLREFEFSAMFYGDDLEPFRLAPDLEHVGLGLINGRWRNWHALLDLPKLTYLQYFQSNQRAEAEVVLNTLKARKVKILAF